jgi:hypothetical protein
MTASATIRLGNHKSIAMKANAKTLPTISSPPNMHDID